MDKNYRSDGYRTIDFTLYKSAIKQLNKEWKKYVRDLNKLQPYPSTFEGRGIVMCAGGLSYFTCCWVAIKALRRSGCKLPVELWYAGNELSEEVMNALKPLGVEFRDFYNYPAAPTFGWRLKPFAILNSRFKEILSLDADNVCVKNPEALFDTSAYREHGAIFWPDYWRTPPENPIWEIVENADFELKEQESGQILLNKEKCWRELLLCQYFNNRSDIYYHLLLGDKDTFKFAWLALKTPFHMITTELASGGYTDNRSNQFLGITMVQHNVEGEICFLHRNLLKWDITKPEELAWQTIKRFLPDARIKEYYIDVSTPNGHLYTDLKGDVEEIDFRKLFGDFEEQCLADLAELRNSVLYARFMTHHHFSNRRYPRHITFSIDN